MSLEPGIPKALLLYDGVCGLCNGMVRWVAKHDRLDIFRFAPQQSPLAEAALARHGVEREAMLAGNSVYLLLDYGVPSERLFRESDVPVNVLLRLGRPWRLLGKLLGIVPKPLRDAGYRLFARNRFRVSPRYESCPIPSIEERAKFLA